MIYPESLILTMRLNDDDEAPNGEWQQRIEDSVEIYNDLNDTYYDPLDAFLYYVTLCK